MNPEQTRAHWRAEESEVRERLAERAGYVRAEQLDGRSGIQTPQAIFAGELPSPPMGDTLGFVPIRIEHGLAVFQGKPEFPLLQPAWNRSAAGLPRCWIQPGLRGTITPAAKGTTLELKVNLVRSLTDAVPLVRAEGILVHSGRQVATAEGRIVGPDTKLYAHATTTCLIFDRPNRPFDEEACADVRHMLVSISLPSSDARPRRSESNGEFAEVCAIPLGPFRAYFNERTERLRMIPAEVSSGR
jgi:acyl-coenzyme A thioesterase PaaI-like protein